MKRLIAATIGVCCSLTAAGENLLQCVAPDVQLGLLFRASNTLPEISDEMPPAIAALPKPADLVWIASMGATGAFRSTGDPGEVFDAVLEELDRDGWDENSRMMRPGGKQLLVACRDDQEVTVQSWLYANVTYVTYSLRAVVETSVCSRASIRTRPGSLSLDDVFPRLDFDAIDRSARTGIQAGGWGDQASGSGFRYTLVTIDADLATLATGLSEQLLAQGWQSETSWSGGGMAGSTWLGENGGKQYVGALDVIDLGDASFTVAISFEEQRQ